MSFDWKMSAGKQQLIAEWVKTHNRYPRSALYLVGGDPLENFSNEEKEILGLLRFPCDETQKREGQERSRNLSLECRQKMIDAIQWFKDYENLPNRVRTHLWSEIQSMLLPEDPHAIFLVIPISDPHTFPLELIVGKQTWPLVCVTISSLNEIQSGTHKDALDFIKYQKSMS